MNEWCLSKENRGRDEMALNMKIFVSTRLSIGSAVFIFTRSRKNYFCVVLKINYLLRKLC